MSLYSGVVTFASPESVAAADRERLLQLKAAMAADGLYMDEVDKKLRALDREEAGPAQKFS